jgi:uridine phosphorylase
LTITAETDTDRPLPITGVRPSQVAPNVLVVGDPARVADAARLLDGARQVAASREYVTVTGSLDGTPVSVCSHGVGSAGAAICFEELARAGVRRIVRAGTCGALQPGIAEGALIVATGAVREEGTTPRLVPLAYPAIAAGEVVGALERAASGDGLSVHRGVVLTTDTFYPSKAMGPAWRIWHEAGVLAIEMELAALLVVSALHGIDAGGVLTVDGNLLVSSADMDDYDPDRDVVTKGKATMLRVALRALTELGRNDRP